MTTRVIYRAPDRESNLPRYYFDIENGHRLIDPSGLDCRNDRDAVSKATVIARQIALDVAGSSGRKIAVLNSNRRLVGQVLVVPTREKSAPRDG